LPNTPDPAKLGLKISKIVDEHAQYNAAALTLLHQRLSEQIASINRLNFVQVFSSIYQALPQIDVSAVSRAITAAIDISALALPLANLDELRKQTQRITEGFSEVMKRVTADLAAISVAYQSISSSGILEHLQEVVQAKQDEVDAFCAAGWPIAPSMSSELRARVVSLYKQRKTRYVSQVIMGYYRRDSHANLTNMVNQWREYPLFRPRFHIIADALDAHQRRKYTLSIPALVPQIEGILNDYVRSNNLVAKLGKIQEVYTAAFGDANDYGLAEWAIVQTLLHQLQTSTYVYTDFKDELNKSARRRQTTRHTVMHGVAVNYNQSIHSLRAFLLLDAISVLE
jgi:hypothetical protein